MQGNYDPVRIKDLARTRIQNPAEDRCEHTGLISLTELPFTLVKISPGAMPLEEVALMSVFVTA